MQQLSGLVVGLIVAAFGIILTAILGYVVRQAGQVSRMREKIAVLETQVSPFWALMQAQIAKDLHHPHPRYAEMDGLLEKLENLTITPIERARLNALLLERAQDFSPDISEVQRKEAKVMSEIMEIVVIEAKGMMGPLAVAVAWLFHWKW